MKTTLPRLSILVGVALWVAAAFMFSVKPLHADGGSCGDQGAVCGADEHCCQHEVAIFGDGGASSPPYKDGNCVAKSESCSDFWCGTRHCEGGIFGTPGVCCISQTSDAQTAYRCAYSDLNCPGNAQQLHIRPQQVASSSMQN